jgi:hypothetical protein
MLAVTGLGMALAGCSASTAPAKHESSRTTAAASPTAAGGPCASVRTTTPIDKVPEPCAEEWAPYQVTEVPPPDILSQEHVPPAPRVDNRTNGAVSQAEAQRWADASNRDSGWYKWAYEFGQAPLLLRLVGPALIPREDEAALGDGARIMVPACDLYPLSYALFPLDADGKAYFARKGVPTSAAFVFVVVYNGPCSVITTYPDGHSAERQDFSRPTTVFQPGRLQGDPLLGDLWFEDTGGGCNDPTGAPAQWCGR